MRYCSSLSPARDLRSGRRRSIDDHDDDGGDDDGYDDGDDGDDGANGETKTQYIC